MSLQGSDLCISLLDQNQPWGVLRQNVKKETKFWPGDQHTTISQCLTSTQRQAARKMISDPSPAADQTRLLSFNRTQSRAVAGHTLKRCLYIMGLTRSATHRLWSLGCWSYRHPNRGHSSILIRLQQSDPIFNMGVDIMRIAFNLEPQYRVIMLMREDWTKATGTPPAVKGLVWFTDGSRMREGTRAGVYGQSV